MTEMKPLCEKPWRSGGWFSIIGRESLAADDSGHQIRLSKFQLSTLTSNSSSIELQPVAQSENSAYRKRRSAGRFSGGVCCASFRSRIDWEKKSAGRYGGGVVGNTLSKFFSRPSKTMEDPNTIDSEAEPPQKAGLRGPARLLQGLGAYSKMPLCADFWALHCLTMTFRRQFRNDSIAPPRPLQLQQQQHSSTTGYGSCAHLEQILQQPKEHGGNQDGGLLWVKIGGDGLWIGAVFEVFAAQVPQTRSELLREMLNANTVKRSYSSASLITQTWASTTINTSMLFYCRLLGLDPKTAKVMGRGLEDLRWYARAWNHELRLPPARHLFHRGKWYARASNKELGPPPQSTPAILEKAVQAFDQVNDQEATRLCLRNILRNLRLPQWRSLVFSATRGAKHLRRKKSTTGSVAVLARQLHDFAYDTTGNSRYPGEGG
ncbi:hypothetical protein BOTNAR_0699g00030 [Botryotinia narcissicola]|uniref:Uncharacterized protein n=1 Tax=Botryotinia narcissicola TaxID=278944 RepID=A0A4Z1HCF3_9HELO|nr:hypothetical protein BOTNAR_0699g00030 [Botryotinia narcissicola]